MKKFILLLVVLVGLPYKLNAQMTEAEVAESTAIISLLKVFGFVFLGMFLIIIFISGFKKKK